LKEDTAKITVNPETKKILDIHLYERNLRFKCKRCAIFCCKLGGPSLTAKDIEQIGSIGYNTSKFVEPAKRHDENSPFMPSAVKSRKDGSCIFLKMDEKSKEYECSIYEVRPTLCRLYPFDFKKIDTNSFLLKFIPCCNGLNNVDGELVDESFIAKYLFENILQLTTN
jgi:Fe-S-cluster containining protein